MTTHCGVAGLPPGSHLAERRLANGLRALAIEVPTARQARLVAAVGAGYLDEPTAWPGLAHLLEHALFLGSARHPQPGDFATWVGEQGGRYNAHTGEYTTDVHLNLPPDATEAGLERLVDILIHPTLACDGIASEVDVIEAEFRARLADPELHRQAAMSRLFQPSHPAAHFHHGHRRSLGGSVDSNPRALHEALTGFHASHYRAERISLVLLGPQPANRQLALLTAAGDSIPAGAGDLPCRPPRWAAAVRVQWRPPSDLAPIPMTLELLWPLPEPLSPAQRQAGECLATALCDGALAATLQHHAAILDLDAELNADTTTPVLSLTLSLSPAGQQQIETLLTTCQAWVADLAKRLPTPVACPTVPHDLDTWPRTLAQRLSLGEAAIPPSADAAPDALSDWLHADKCRVLEPLPASRKACETASETGTLLRLVSPPMTTGISPWPRQPPPTFECRSLVSDTMSVTPGLVATDDDFPLWWGGGPPLIDAYLGLAWPAPPSESSARLRHWHQCTLPLRQAAFAQGLNLTLGSDGRGDWALSWGDAGRLESCLAQVLAAWQPHVEKSADASEQGLLAQRLLARLDDLPPPDLYSQPTLVAWAGGTMSASDAMASCRRLAVALRDRLPSPATSHSHHTSPASADIAHWPTQWLSSQGEDQAVMLQVDAPDDSPTSQTLFQLLAQCHDAPFHYELRQHRHLGYVAAVRYREASGWPRLGYVVQSPSADIAILRQAVCEFLITQGTRLAHLDATVFERRRQALTATWGPPETPEDALSKTWQALRRGSENLAPWQAQEASLAALTPGMLASLADALAAGRLSGQWWFHTPSPVVRHWL
ncbi:coenzyme PQQ synthesis protein F [Litchfieldella qijiaojingensis]|uniref:Coenzyme PQQ synthesis protein F n=1 Tax=Litchfieldella qijiaojingensis TaxID=980347 RepID=A0ABQ2ZB09_9GAMM|nr:insulinase family protein [Halomonas qijiaojingensis]GGY09090.1 coenzyme PQQ synthesis protein F [Halomonas qijiaojingensis]